MLNRARRGVETIILAACLSLSGCAYFKGAGPSRIDTTMAAIDAAMALTKTTALAACERSDDPPKCIWRAHEAHDAAMGSVSVIKKWVPELKQAIEDKDKIWKRDALEHIEAALEEIPEAYEDVRDLVLKLSHR
jgi:hypothetical protein